MGSGQVRIPGVGVVPVQKSDPAAKPEREYNPLRDLVIASGGLNRADARRMGTAVSDTPARSAA